MNLEPIQLVQGDAHPDHRIEQLDQRLQRLDRWSAARACGDEVSVGPGTLWIADSEVGRRIRHE